MKNETLKNDVQSNPTANIGYVARPSNGDELNHQAYDDVFDRRVPSMPENEYYMQCYRFWSNINPKQEDH